MLNLLIDLAIGALVGWVASLIMHFLGFYAATRWAQFMVALGGACLVLWLDKKYLQ